MEENQGLPYPLGHGGVCPECGSINTTYDPNFGYRVCENCIYIWGLAQDDPDYDEEPLDVGTCCICGEENSKVRNFVTIERLAPIPGTGWGCIVCDLPSDGAVAVICDDCLPERGSHLKLKQVILGYPAEKKRIDFDQLLPGRFSHVEELHERDELGYGN